MRYKNPVDTYFGYFPLLQNYLTAGRMIFFSSAVNSYQWLDYLGHALSCHGCRASVGPTEWRPSPCEQGSLCAGSAGVCSVLQDLGAQICKGQTLSVVLHRASIWIQSDLLAVLISDPYWLLVESFSLLLLDSGLVIGRFISLNVLSVSLRTGLKFSSCIQLESGALGSLG